MVFNQKKGVFAESSFGWLLLVVLVVVAIIGGLVPKLNAGSDFFDKTQANLKAIDLGKTPFESLTKEEQQTVLGNEHGRDSVRAQALIIAGNLRTQHKYKEAIDKYEYYLDLCIKEEEFKGDCTQQDVADVNQDIENTNKEAVVYYSNEGQKFFKANDCAAANDAFAKAKGFSDGKYGDGTYVIPGYMSACVDSEFLVLLAAAEKKVDQEINSALADYNSQELLHSVDKQPAHAQLKFHLSYSSTLLKYAQNKPQNNAYRTAYEHYLLAVPLALQLNDDTAQTTIIANLQEGYTYHQDIYKKLKFTVLNLEFAPRGSIDECGKNNFYDFSATDDYLWYPQTMKYLFYNGAIASGNSGDREKTVDIENEDIKSLKEIKESPNKQELLNYLVDPDYDNLVDELYSTDLQEDLDDLETPFFYDITVRDFAKQELCSVKKGTVDKKSVVGGLGDCADYIAFTIIKKNGKDARDSDCGDEQSKHITFSFSLPGSSSKTPSVPPITYTPPLSNIPAPVE